MSKEQQFVFKIFGRYICHFILGKSGYFRLGRLWYGIGWKPKTERMLFSERNGYYKTMVIGNKRFKLFTPE